MQLEKHCETTEAVEDGRCSRERKIRDAAEVSIRGRELRKREETREYARKSDCRAKVDEDMRRDWVTRPEEDEEEEDRVDGLANTTGRAKRR